MKKKEKLKVEKSSKVELYNYSQKDLKRKDKISKKSYTGLELSKRLGLLLYTYRILFGCSLVVLLICVCVGLWVAFGFFKKYDGANYINYSYFNSSFENADKNDNSFYSKALKSNLFSFLGSYSISSHSQVSDSNLNYIHDGTIIYIGSSASKETRDMVDVESKRWSKVSKYNVLYQYSKNKGPLNSYAENMKKKGGNAYWQTQKFHSEYLKNLKYGDFSSKIINPYVVGYVNHDYKLNQKEGLPQTINPISRIIYSIVSFGARNTQTNAEIGHLYNEYVTRVTYSGTAGSKYKRDKKNDPDNANYFNNYLDNEFTFDDSNPVFNSNGPKSIKSYSFLGIVHKAYYYKNLSIPGGDQPSVVKVPCLKLFTINDVLNKQQISDFIYWVYTGTVHFDSTTGKLDPVKPFWDQNPPQ